MHTINLTAAWDRLDLPGGETIWARRFGRPTGIDPPLEAWLVAEPALLSRCWLNGGRLTEGNWAEVATGVRVTGRLAIRNLLLLLPTGLPAAAVPAISRELNSGNPVTTRSALPADLGRVMLTVTAGGLDSLLPNRR